MESFTRAKEMADPGPSHLSLPQNPRFTVTLLHCPSTVPLWKAYFILNTLWIQVLCLNNTFAWIIAKKKIYPATHHLSLWLISSQIFVSKPATLIHSY